jgi:hypothetical protein
LWLGHLRPHLILARLLGVADLSAGQPVWFTPRRYPDILLGTSFRPRSSRR